MKRFLKWLFRTRPSPVPTLPFGLSPEYYQRRAVQQELDELRARVTELEKLHERS